MPGLPRPRPAESRFVDWRGDSRAVAQRSAVRWGRGSPRSLGLRGGSRLRLVGAALARTHRGDALRRRAAFPLDVRFRRALIEIGQHLAHSLDDVGWVRKGSSACRAPRRAAHRRVRERGRRRLRRLRSRQLCLRGVLVPLRGGRHLLAHRVVHGGHVAERRAHVFLAEAVELAVDDGPHGRGAAQGDAERRDLAEARPPRRWRPCGCRRPKPRPPRPEGMYMSVPFSPAVTISSPCSTVTGFSTEPSLSSTPLGSSLNSKLCSRPCGRYSATSCFRPASSSSRMPLSASAVLSLK